MNANTKECALGLKKCEPRTLSEAVHCVSRHSGLDTHRLAELLEADYATFIRWTEPNGACQLPGRKFAPLAQHTGRVDHLAWIARDAGLIVSERIGGSRIDELLDVCGRLGKLAAECKRL